MQEWVGVVVAPHFFAPPQDAQVVIHERFGISHPEPPDRLGEVLHLGENVFPAAELSVRRRQPFIKLKIG